jgi:hypothetical protein
MTLRTFAGALALVCVVLSPAAAQTRFDNDGHQISKVSPGIGAQTGGWKLSQGFGAVAGHRRHARGSQVAVGRPDDCRGIPWCGCYLRHVYGIADRAFDQARHWASWGTKANGPAPGVIAVFARGKNGGHVGIVTGVPGPGRIVLKSGNDGHRVRERERSTGGVIAYRWPPWPNVAMQ